MNSRSYYDLEVLSLKEDKEISRELQNGNELWNKISQPPQSKVK